MSKKVVVVETEDAEVNVPLPPSALAESNEERIFEVEKAIIQINHFTEMLDSLNLPRWMGYMEGQMLWIKLLLGASVVAGIAQAILAFIRGG